MNVAGSSSGPPVPVASSPTIEADNWRPQSRWNRPERPKDEQPGLSVGATIALVPLQAGPELPDDVFGYPTAWVLVGVAVLGLVLGGMVRFGRERWSAYRFGSQVRKLDADRPTAAYPPGRDFLRSGQSVERRQPVEYPALTGAVSRFEAGEYDEAVEGAYRAVREELSGVFDIQSGVTHWEFYEACREAPLGDPLEDLFELTSLYERAAFDIPRVSYADADAALEAARALLGRIPATQRTGDETESAHGRAG